MALPGSPILRLCRPHRRQGQFSLQQHWSQPERSMPDPIPRNSSARGPAPRPPERHGVWPGRLFRRLRGNTGQPRPPRPQPRHAAKHKAQQGRPYRRPQGNAGQPRQPRSQTRHAVRPAAWPSRLFRRLQGNAGLGPPPLTPTRRRTEVMVGALLFALAVLAGIVVLQLLPSETSSTPTVAPPASDRADVPAPGGGAPGPRRVAGAAGQGPVSIPAVRRPAGTYAFPVGG